MPLTQVGADLFRETAYVVGRRHCWALLILQGPSDIREARLVHRMQHVPTFGVNRVAAQLVEACHAPNIGCDLPLVLEQCRRGDYLAQDGPTTEQLDTFLFARALSVQVHAADDAVLDTLRHGWLHVVFVHHRDVVEDIVLFFVHLLHAVVQDDRQFIGKGRIVGPAVRDESGLQMAMAVLMLQAFAGERCASSSTP